MTLIKKADINNKLPARRRSILLPFGPANPQFSNEASRSAIGVSVNIAVPVDRSIVNK